LRAIDLNPSNADAYHRYGYLLMRQGKFDEALAKFEKASELNPLSVITPSNIGMTFLCARRYREAIERLEKVTAENPQFSFPLFLLGTVYEEAGDPERAFQIYLRALEIDGGREFAERLKKVKETDGLPAANRLWLTESIKARATRYVSPLEIAVRAAGIKDREQTLFWLEKALEEGDTTQGGTRYFARFDFVRDDPRFKAVESKLAF
jgi:tetratricopeptide (TPR) repeat protein